MSKIQTKAKAHGTFNSPTTGSILYVDPDHAEERYHSPLLTHAEAAFAFERGLIEDPDGAKEASEKEEEFRDPNAIGTVAAARTEEFAEHDAAGGPGSGTLDSRSSTAWPDRERVEGGADGFVAGAGKTTNVAGTAPADVDEESGDDDAPPAPTGRRRAATSQ